MLTVRIFSIGKIKQKFVLEGEKEYLTRIKSPFRVELIEIPSDTKGSPEEIMKREAEALRLKVGPREKLFLLCEDGKQFTSHTFSALIEKDMTEGVSNMSLAIGGAYGWDKQFRKEASFTLSLSPMTFPFQMTRLILIEQLYRAHTLINNIPYHK